MASNTSPKKAQPIATKPASRKKDAGAAVAGKRRTDWEAVERDYRTGRFTLRELETKYEVNKQVILGHRTGLQELTSVKRTLLGQIQQAAALLPDLAEVIEMVRKPDDNGIDRANDALRKAMSRSALVDDLKKLADVDEKVRKGEREAFGLDDIGKPEDEGLAAMATAELQRLRERLLND